MSEDFQYDQFVMRNAGYIHPQTQKKIRETTILIAGCGMGSGVAVCAARTGFEKFVLVDGDQINAHNLNRQFYDFADVGKWKVDALKEKILRINPQVQVEALGLYLDAKNADGIIMKSDIVFDTVDFLDLSAIITLHQTAKKQHKPIFTALNVGFGSLVWYFAPDSYVNLVDIIAPDISRFKTGEAMPAYADVFESFLGRLASHIDKEVIDHIHHVVKMMKDGIPCPASQVAVGSFSVAALALSMICDLLDGKPIPAAPKMVIQSCRYYQTKIVEI